MNTAIESHCETALESPYSRDRQQAVQELQHVYPETNSDGKQRILETLREVTHESSSKKDRKLAREALAECFEEDPSAGEAVVVDTFCELVEDSKFSEERLDAIDSLRQFYPTASEQYREIIGHTLAEIAGNATYGDERNRARRRLSDISREQRESGDEKTRPTEEVGYLGQSLAEHLESAADEGTEDCLQRAEEVREFLAEHPVEDESHEKVTEDVESLIEQLEVVPTGDTLDDDRRKRVERIAQRIDRLYTRQ
jgi:ubiquinone biosynthesis protein UbiJ